MGHFADDIEDGWLHERRRHGCSACHKTPGVMTSGFSLLAPATREKSDEVGHSGRQQRASRQQLRPRRHNSIVTRANRQRRGSRFASHEMRILLSYMKVSICPQQ